MCPAAAHVHRAESGLISDGGALEHRHHLRQRVAADGIDQGCWAACSMALPMLALVLGCGLR